MLELGSVTSALRRILVEIENAAIALDTMLPERQYITTAGAVYDCAQVTVSANTIRTGIAGDETSGLPVGGCDAGWNVDLELSIVRDAMEMPSGRDGTKPPKVECIEEDTAQADTDTTILIRAIETVAGPDFDQFGRVPCTIQFGEVEGGLFAVVASCTLNLWEIPPEPTP